MNQKKQQFRKIFCQSQKEINKINSSNSNSNLTSFKNQQGSFKKIHNPDYFYNLKHNIQRRQLGTSSMSSAGLSGFTKFDSIDEIASPSPTRMLEKKKIRTRLMNMTPVELKQKLDIKSQSLKRSIRNSEQQDSIPIQIGINTMEKQKILAKYLGNHSDLQKRYPKPQQFKTLVQNFTEMCQPLRKEVKEVKSYCRNQKTAEKAALKYFARKQNVLGKSYQKGTLVVQNVIENHMKEKAEQDLNKEIQDQLKQHVQKKSNEFDNRVSFERINPNFEMDTLFKIQSKDFVNFEQNYLMNNKFTLNGEKEYNKYIEYYQQPQNRSIYFSESEKEQGGQRDEQEDSERDESDSVSLTSEDVNRFMEDTNRKEIQRWNYRNKIKNPFIEKEEQIKIMKLLGILKFQNKG